MDKRILNWGTAVGCLVILFGVLYLGMTNPQPAWEVAYRQDIGTQQVERIGILSRDDCILRDGADLYFYSDDQSTQKLHVDGATGNLDLEGTLDLLSTLNVDGAVTLNSTLDVDGNITSGTGGITVTDNVFIDGQADAAQLLVQAYQTETGKTFTVEAYDGTDKLTVDSSGNLVVVGTSDLQGNVSDSGGTVTVADNVLIDGAADAEQLIVQGYSTQTTDLFVAEISDGTDKFQINAAGNITVAGTSNLIGNISDSGGAVTIADNVLIDGQADAAQMIVQGNATQTTDLFVAEISDGTDKFQINAAGNITVAGTSNLVGNISDSDSAVTFADNVMVDGAADAIQLQVQGNSSQTTDLFVAEASNGTDVFQINNSGNITVAGTSNLIGNLLDSGGTLTVGDDFAVTGSSDLQGNLADSAGTLTIADDVLIDGAADAAQLVVQGNATQTTDLFVAEISDGTDKFQINAAGNITVAGTSNLIGNVSDSGGTFTIADDVLIDGAADAAQLIVQGYSTQSTDLFVAEISDGTDKFQINAAGNITVAGTSNLIGNVSDSGGTLTFDDDIDVTGASDFDGAISSSSFAITMTDNVIIDGQEDAIQLTVQGYSTQTSSPFVIEQSDGTDVVTVSNAGAIVASSYISTTNEIQIGTMLNFGMESDVTVVNSLPFTPTTSYCPISAAGWVSPTIEVTGYTTGDLLILVNVSAQKIYLADAANNLLSANFTLEQYDTLTLLFDGSKWVELSRSDN